MKPLNEIPSSVYRLQLGSAFPLKKVIEILPYLHNLGIEGIYTSPIFKSVSDHGYDVLDPLELEPRLGTMEDLYALREALKQYQMFFLLDIVPNHMAIQSSYWYDVMAQGPASPFAPFFDIQWEPEKKELQGKVLLPILQISYAQTLDHQQITVKGQEIVYKDYLLPLRGESENDLHSQLEKQFYRLSHWLVGRQEINYRRFFNINHLAALCIEKEEVFAIHHSWIKQLIEEKVVQGLRIDHPDGLLLPKEYFERVAAFNPALMVIEKILSFEEKAVGEWKIDGTVGYEFISHLNGVFVKGSHEAKFSRIYEKFIGASPDPDKLLYQKKMLILDYLMGAEINALGLRLARIAEKNPYTRDFTRVDLTRALKEIIAYFPVYRTYIFDKVSKQDRETLLFAIERAKHSSLLIDPLVFNYIRDVLLLEFKYAPEQEALYNFVLRFQQFTAPIMAKGLEDCFFFAYNRFISLNEVGHNPKIFGISAKKFHDFLEKKREKWPLGLLPSSTHDTKRSEDVRQRLNVLSEMPSRWQERVEQWSKVNAPLMPPERNMEYYIYQTLVGIWEKNSSLEARFTEHVLKAAREAKSYTSWENPQKAYEEGLTQFVKALLQHSPFLTTFEPFCQEIAYYGELNSLSASVLKLGGPGIVDIYQGAENPFFALTDPDNRTPPTFSNPLNPKHIIHYKALNFRRLHKSLFLEGSYLPLKVEGKLREHVIAFARTYQEQKIVVLATRFFVDLVPPFAPFDPHPFSEEELLLPFSDSYEWEDIFTSSRLLSHKNGKKTALPLKDALSTYPCAIFLVHPS